MLVVTRQLQIPLAEFEITFVRSSGPGGQNVNKVNSKAVLRWDVRGSRCLTDEVRSVSCRNTAVGSQPRATCS